MRYNLKYVKFSRVYPDYILDGDKIIAALNQTLPKKLNTIIFENTDIFEGNSLDTLVDNWKGPKPFKIELIGYYYSPLFSKQIKKYQDLGFLKV